MSTAMETPLIHAQKILQVLLHPAPTHLSINHLTCRLTLPKACLLPHPCVSITHKSTLTAFTACNHWLFVNLRHCSAPIGQEPWYVDLDILNMTSHKARPYHQQSYWREGLRRGPWAWWIIVCCPLNKSTGHMGDTAITTMMALT